MLLVTSVMCNGNDQTLHNQKAAIATWQKIGFQVISVNTREEICMLEGNIPNVTFLELERTALEEYGKPVPYIFDMLKVLKENCITDNEICGIINSDIYLRNMKRHEMELLFDEYPKLVCIHRYDIDSTEVMDGEYYFSGMDAFFMQKKSIDVFEDAGYALGKPEWDHWMVYTAVKNHLMVQEIKNAVAFHVRHPQRWTAGESNNMGGKGTREEKKETYYDITNMILADLDNRILVGDLDNQKDVRITMPQKEIYLEQDFLKIVRMELERHHTEALTFPLGVGYYKNGKFYRICALHGDIIGNEKTVHVCEDNGKEIVALSSGVMAAYVDFMKTEAVEQLGRFYIYPAGRAGRMMLDCLLWNGKKPLGFIDRDEKLQGTAYKGIKIGGMDELKRTETYDKILLVSNLYVEEIYRELRKIVSEDKIMVI